MGFPTQVVSLAERSSTIVGALSGSESVTHFVPARDRYLEVPVIDLPSRILVYRVENGRIMSELADEARKLEVTLEHFQQHWETLEVQQLLHRLLLDKARAPEAPIYRELEQYGRQTEPLLVQRDGVILNGNRRLAAMRELAERNGKQFAQFETVRAALLPDGLDREQLEMIEAALQMAPNLKLEYGWINRRLKLRQHVRDMSRESVVAAYRFTDVSRIDVELQELELAESYLRWLGKPQRYALVEKNEKHFTQLNQKLRALNQDHLREVWSFFGFAMLKAAASLDTEILHYFPFAEPAPPALRQWVPRTLAEDHGLTDRQAVGENHPVDKALAAKLIPLVADPTRAETTAVAVLALSDALKGDARKLIGVDQLLAQLRRAYALLEEMDVQAWTPIQSRRIRTQIAALREYVDTRSQPLPGRSERPDREGERLVLLSNTWRTVWRDAKRVTRRGMDRLTRSSRSGTD